MLQLTILGASEPGDIFASAKVGAGLFAAAATFGSFSGGHFNPAVTLVNLANRSITVGRFASYIGAQSAGALLALGLFKGLGYVAQSPSSSAVAAGASVGVADDTIADAVARTV